MDICKPLRRGLWLKLGVNETRRLGVKYERLNNFCYACGMMDHLLKECEEPWVEVDEGDTKNFPFSPDLRALLLKPNVVFPFPMNPFMGDYPKQRNL